MKKLKFADGGETAEEKLEKYIRVPAERVGRRYPSSYSKLPAASRAARLAAGEKPMEDHIRYYSSAEAEEGDKLRPFAKNVLAEERQKISELADQYKRESSRGNAVRDTSLRGKIREMTGMKKGGMTASKRADGIAQRGKTRGKMY
jgi:hypothetical protein